MFRMAAACYAVLAFAGAPARAQDELLGAPESEVQFLPRPGEPAKPKNPSAKPAAKKASPKAVATPMPKVAVKAVAKPKAKPTKVARPSEITAQAKDDPVVAIPVQSEPAPRTRAHEGVPAREVAQVEPTQPTDEIYESAYEAPARQEADTAAPRTADGQTAGFYAEPRIAGQRVFVDYYYFRGAPRRAEEASTDEFCRHMGYRRGAYYSVARTRAGEALEDVLCLR